MNVGDKPGSPGQTPGSAAAATTAASKELDGLNEEIAAARALLVRLLHEVVEAESHAGHPQVAHIVMANQQLVLATLRAQAEAELAARALNEVSRSAELDTLTRLPNRVLVLDRLTQAITLAQRNGVRLALLFLDLDNFKHINDTLGHGVGDEVLKLVAMRLAGTVRAADSVGRHGGDEFLILLTDVSAPGDAVLIADKLLSALSAPGLVGEHVLRVTASIGIAFYPDDGIDAQTLVANADAAMYHAKRQSLGRANCADKAAWDAQGSRKPLRTWYTTPVMPLVAAQADHELRHAQLREANQKLVLAALDAQQLQSAAEQALRKQSGFMATVAAELKNPLAPIRLAAAMLGRRKADPLLPRVQQIFDEQVAQITHSVNKLHEVSSVSAGVIAVQKVPVDLAEVVTAALAERRPAMDLRVQHLQLQLPLHAVELLGDFDRLVQVVNNLLDNATKYTPQGGRIELSAEQSGDTAVISVADNGIGISAAALTTIFEPFVQDVRAAGYNGAGPGLGLTVVRAVVAAHGGSVSASSDGPGRGSRFVVRLPLKGSAEVAS